jgi:2,4-dienoyl-CoA reductase (NADPH2)
VLEGSTRPDVLSYPEAITDPARVGPRVAVVGAGGIGVDVSHLLSHDGPETVEEWMSHWGVGDPALHPGGLTEKKPRSPAREVYLLQRKTTPIGKGLAKTSGWAHRTVLRDSGVTMIPGVGYERIDDDGLHVTVDGEPRLLEVDTVVVCAGQESERRLYDDLVAAGRAAHLVGGADVAAELDAKRAIDQATRLAATL